MTIYRVLDNGDHVLTTVDELKALREFYKRMQKRDEVMDWGWIDEEIVQ